MKNQLQPGKVLASHYRIEEKIGQGGVGTVYSAVDLNLNRKVAIKTILWDKLTPHYRQPRFRFEAEVIASLQHPNIVKIYEIIEEDDCPYIVMEYLHGTTLENAVLKDNLTRSQVVSNIIIACSAVNYAHYHELLHRDIKPGNIMITDEGVLKVLDFGLAKRLEDNEEIDAVKPNENIISGSPAFMSPEQAKGKDWTLDIRSDIYSMGATLYFSLTQKVPVSGISQKEILSNLINGNLKPLPTCLKEFPQDLEAICNKAMAYDVKDRYEFMRDLGEDLARFQAGLPVTARKYGSLETILSAIKHGKEIFISASLIIFFMLAGLQYSLNYIYLTAKQSIQVELRKKVQGIATTGVFAINPNDVDSIQIPEDRSKPEFIRTVKLLKKIQRSDPSIRFAWVMRLSNKKEGYSEFVVEDSMLDSFDELDENHNGVIDTAERPADIGMIYEDSLNYPDLQIGYTQPTADREIGILDEWNVSLSGYAPIRNQKGESIAVLGVDLTNSDVMKSMEEIDRGRYITWAVVSVLSISLFIVLVIWLISRWQSSGHSKTQWSQI